MGVQISGDTGNVLATKGTYTGNLTVGGVLTYEDVTNVDSVGLVTARSGIEIGARPGVAASISVDGNMIISGISTFGDDITFTGATSGRDVVFDTSLNQIRAQDNAKLCAGSSSDLEIYHNGSTSYIDNYTGALYLRNNVSSDVNGDIYIQAKSGENSIACYDDGAVELYHDNSKKIETISTGVVITGSDDGDGGAKGDFKFFQTDGTLKIMFDASTSQFEFLDNSKASFGHDDDLKIYHDGSNSRIYNTHTGVFYFDTAGELQLRSTSTKKFIRAVQDGAVELYHNNEKKLYTYGEGVYVQDDSGASVYVALVSNAGAQGSLYGTANTLGLLDGQNHYMLKGVKDGGVELYHDNAKKCETTSEGTKITGYIKATSDGNLVNTGVYHESFTTYNNQHVHWFQHNGTNSAQQYGIRIKSADDGNDVISHIQCSSGGATSFVVRRTGSVESRNNSYGGVSDIKLKENIVDANSQWDDIKNIKIRNFNFKDNPTKKMLGVVAQEIELVSAGLVEDIPDLDDTNEDLGTVTKVVKSSILYMKAIKALQEAQTRIETLETEVAALKSS